MMKGGRSPERSELSRSIAETIRSIPAGRVLTYGGVAAAAGNPRGARAVVWILHSSSEREGLPWHRVVNSKGSISLEPGYGYEEQRALLEDEGVRFGDDGRIDLSRYLWSPE